MSDDEPETERQPTRPSEEPTRVRPGEPPTEVAPAPRRPRGPGRPGRLTLALGIAGGFLAGVLLVAILGGAKPAIRESTVTVSQTTTVVTTSPAPPSTVTNGGTVITKTVVPQVVGERLDTALERIARAGFDVDSDGGGLFGVVVESNWEVTSQDPAPGGFLEQGSTIRIKIARR